MAIRVVATPVIFTNNAGGGSDELQAPQNGRATKDFEVGGTVQATWWAPLDNIGDLPAITFIETSPNGNYVTLTAGGHPNNRDARVRIMIWASTA